MKLKDLNYVLVELVQPIGMDQTVAPDPTQPKPSPQAQMAQHQKDITTKKKQIQDQITFLNKQIMDLKKQLSQIR